MACSRFVETFHGQVAVVTGAASGIGRALCEGLVAAGALVVGADIDLPGLEALHATLGDRFRAERLDVTDAAAFARVLEAVYARTGRLDFLFNNAGVSVMGEVRDQTLHHWQRVLDVNLRGVVHGVAAAYPIMVAQGHGHIVNTASGYGLLPGPGVVPYAASKHAVVGLSVSLRAEAEALGVRVSALCPGVVETSILTTSTHIGLDPKTLLTNLPFKLQSPAACARVTLRGVEKNRALIITPFYVRVLWWLNRFCPWLVARLNRHIINRQRAANPRPAGPPPH